MTRRRSQDGGVLIETVMVAPVLLLLLVGMTELARVGYTYYALQKALYTLARYVGTQQGVNFCDTNDATVLAAKNLAVTGSVDGTATALIRGLTNDQLDIRIERYNPVSGSLDQCDCSPSGCDASTGGLPPDFVVAYMPNGYNVQPIFPKFLSPQFQLRPTVRVPYGGT